MPGNCGLTGRGPLDTVTVFAGRPPREESNSRAGSRTWQRRRSAAHQRSLPLISFRGPRLIPFLGPASFRAKSAPFGLAAFLLLATPSAFSFPLVAKDTPNDGGGSVTVEWSAPGAVPKQWVLVRRERGGTFAPLATIDGAVQSYRDDAAGPDGSYEYQLVAAPMGSASDSEISGPARAIANWFDSTKLNVLVVAGIFFALLFFYIRQAEAGKRWTFRKIPGLDAIEEAIGRATEMGKGVLYIPGVQEIDDIQTIASMILLSRVSKMCAKYETDLLIPTNAPGVFTVAEEVVKSGYADVGRTDAYRNDQVRYITSEQFAYVSAVNGLMLRTKPAANLLLGAFFAESLLLAETGHSIGAIQIAGTANVHQMPFFVVACDYTLIGEEYYAASALLSADNRLLGSLKASDTVKIVIVAVIVVGAILTSLGQHGFLDLFATQ